MRSVTGGRQTNCAQSAQIKKRHSFLRAYEALAAMSVQRVRLSLCPVVESTNGERQTRYLQPSGTKRLSLELTHWKKKRGAVLTPESMSRCFIRVKNAEPVS